MSRDSAEQQFRTCDVTVQKFRTKRGERAEIATETDYIRLDALILESLSWQRSRNAIAAQIPNGTVLLKDETPLTGGESVDSSSQFQITNEYAQVTLSHVRTTGGEALQLTTPARGAELNLGPRSLRALTELDDTFVFSEFFETPVGPEDTPVEGPH